jgi:hypothetical protein
VDFSLLFMAAPSPYVVLDLDLVVVEVNSAYCAIAGRDREELLGQPLFETFPDNPAEPAAHGSSAVVASLRRAQASGRPDIMPLQRYDTLDPSTGRYAERYWSVINLPVLDRGGGTVWLLHRPEEVTGYVQSHRSESVVAPAVDTAEDDGRLGLLVEASAEVYARTQEVQAAWEAEHAARRRLAAVSEVALALARAQTVDYLTTVVFDQGLAALGSDGGAVAVLDGDHLNLSITSSLGERTRTTYGRLPLEAAIPACVAASTGRPVVLPDAAASRAFSSEMDAVLAGTGCQAWIALPLHADHAVLGSLVVGWADPHPFPPAELAVLDALAAQCSYGLERIQPRQAELAVAAQVHRMSETLQRSMLTEPDQPDHLQLAVRYAPAADHARVGGDWYDAFLDRDGALCLVIGDVAGHDRNAAAIMGQLRNLLRGIVYAVGDPPDAILATLDGAIRHLDITPFATAVLAKVEQTPADAAAGQRRLRWTNAGHPAPLLIDPDGTARFLDTAPEMFLGAATGATRSDHEQLLVPGSTLLLYTDGLVERRDADIDTGLHWLAQTAARFADRSLDELCDTLLAAVDAHTDDDVALLAVRAHPEDRPRSPEAGPQALPNRTRAGDDQAGPAT